MAEHRTNWPIEVMCETLEISRSGYYDYVKTQSTDAVPDDLDLLTRIKAIHAETGQCYGSRRMTKALQAEGYQVGRYKVRRLMKDAGVSVRRRSTRKPQTTDSRHGYGVAPNVLNREFDVAQPNEAWVGDITYLWTQEGWLYLAVLLDLYSRKVVGWSLSSHVDRELVQGALEMAIGRRHPEAGLIHHTDRGSQYASHAYRDMLSQNGMVCSMSGKGDCLDNAVAERFFGSLKRERTSHRNYEMRQEARDDVIDYIEMFYNSTRLHSYLGYTSPNKYEKMPRAA
jgi:transposase InsO family protein